MAIIKSAKKNIRKSARNRVFNLRRSRGVESVVKEIKNLLADGKAVEARALLPKAQKAFGKAAKAGTIKDNTASRKVSRLSAMIKKATVK